MTQKTFSKISKETGIPYSFIYLFSINNHWSRGRYPRSLDESQVNTVIEAFKEKKLVKKNKRTSLRIYSIWSCMKQRCYNDSHTAWKWYGGKGIKVCSEWLDFDTFNSWALKNGYNDKLTIDRIDADKNYEPSNCQWITLEENRGKRKCRKIQVKCIETEQVFNSIYAASKAIRQASAGSIYLAITSKTKKKKKRKAGGYTWERA